MNKKIDEIKNPYLPYLIWWVMLLKHMFIYQLKIVFNVCKILIW